MTTVEQILGGNMDIPVGTVCTIVNGTGNVYEEFIGKECTVLESRRVHDTIDREGHKGWQDGHICEVQGFGKCTVNHKNLITKRYPGQLQSWLNTKMNDLLVPKPNLLAE